MDGVWSSGAVSEFRSGAWSGVSRRPLSIRGHSYDLCRAVVFHVVFMESCVSRLLSSARRRLGCRVVFWNFGLSRLPCPWALSVSLAGLRAQHDSASASEPALRPPQRKRKKRKLFPSAQVFRLPQVSFACAASHGSTSLQYCRDNLVASAPRERVLGTGV